MIMALAQIPAVEGQRATDDVEDGVVATEYPMLSLEVIAQRRVRRQAFVASDRRCECVRFVH